jgi:hypothetical protein
VAAMTRRRPPLQDRSPALLCHQPRAGATLVRGTFLRTADLRSQSAYISLAGHRPMPRRRVVATPGPAHHRRPDPGSTITSITKVVLTHRCPDLDSRSHIGRVMTAIAVGKVAIPQPPDDR